MKIQADTATLIHPIKKPSRGISWSGDSPIMSPREWADFTRAPITDDVLEAEAAYREKYGGEIVECTTTYPAENCTCGHYEITWPVEKADP